MDLYIVIEELKVDTLNKHGIYLTNKVCYKIKSNRSSLYARFIKVRLDYESGMYKCLKDKYRC
jgi:hypothetical protein